MKKLLETTIGLIFGVYMFGVMISTTYNTWQDIKQHDSFIRYIFVSPVVGFINSFTWPYDVYVNNFEETTQAIETTQDNTLSEVQVNNINQYMRAQNNFVSAMTLTREIRVSKDPKGDLEKIDSLLNSTKEKILATDRMVLNNFYHGLGDIAHDKLLKMAQYYQSGMQRDGDRSNIARGDALLIDYNEWMANNWGKVGKALNQN